MEYRIKCKEPTREYFVFPDLAIAQFAIEQQAITHSDNRFITSDINLAFKYMDFLKTQDPGYTFFVVLV